MRCKESDSKSDTHQAFPDRACTRIRQADHAPTWARKCTCSVHCSANPVTSGLASVVGAPPAIGSLLGQHISTIGNTAAHYTALTASSKQPHYTTYTAYIQNSRRSCMSQCRKVLTQRNWRRKNFPKRNPSSDGATMSFPLQD